MAAFFKILVTQFVFCCCVCAFVSCLTFKPEGRFAKTNIGTRFVESFARAVCLLSVWFLQYVGDWRSSVSLSGGNQVDGLPPAPSRQRASMVVHDHSMLSLVIHDS